MPKTQIEPLLAPRGGLRLDLPGTLISPLEMTDCANVFFEDGLVKKRFGYKKMGGNLPLSGAVMGSDQFYLFGGGNFLLMMTTKDIYKWNKNNEMWELLTPSTDLERCTTGWSAGSGDTIAADSDNEVEGSTCTKITLAAQRTDGKLLAYKDITSADISSHNSIGFWLRSNVAIAAEGLEVVVCEGKGAAKLQLIFTSGGTYEIKVGDIITGATSEATAVVCGVTLASGTWAGGDAEGILYLHNQSGTFEAENLDVGANENEATIAADSSATTYRDSLSLAIAACISTGDNWKFTRIVEDLTAYTMDKQIAFTSGGTYVVAAGNTIIGATSEATAVVVRVVLTSGSWAGEDAKGILFLTNQSGTFEAENLNVGANENVATIGSDTSSTNRSVGLYANSTIASGKIIYIDDIRAYTPFTGEDSDSFSYDYIRKLTEAEPWWICTNGVDVVQYWDGDAACLADLSADAPLAKRLVAFKDHLHLLDVDSGTRFPQRIHWSDTGDPTNWTTGNSLTLDLPGADWISNGVKFKGDYLVVLKERSIEVGYATGDTEIFQFDCKVTGAGCAAPDTIESLGDEIVFLGWDDVYVFNGIDYEPIGTPIQRELFRTLNPEQIGRCFGVIIEEQKEYWLFVPSTTSTYPDMAWCFNYELNKWTKHTFADNITAFGYYFLEAARTWDDLTGTWQQQDWRWDDRTILKHAPTTIFGDSEGYIYEYDRLTHNDDDTAIDAYFDTKDFNFTQLTGRQRILRLDTYYTGNSLDVSYSTDKGKTWTAIGTLSASDNLEIPRRLFLRLDCNMVRFKFRNANSGEHFEFSRCNIHWQEAGERL